MRLHMIYILQTKFVEADLRNTYVQHTATAVKMLRILSSLTTKRMMNFFMKLLIYYGFIICCSKSLYASALTCDANGTCKCSGSSKDGTQTTTLEKFLCDGEKDCADGSDEWNCVKRECHNDEHKCSNGRCIKTKWTCDSYKDCPDGSDESQSLCNFTTCALNQFRCYNGFCLPGTFRCDKEKDCLEGEDEDGCVYPKNCSTGYFLCKTNKCIDNSFVCDGDNDCGDNSDEVSCGKTCGPNSFTCNSGQCVRQNLKCNGKSDCKDGSDEISCPTVSTPKCRKDEFLCDGECWLDFVRCDGDKDCNDGADEANCDTIKCATSSEELCDDGKSCVMKYKFCNGKADCADGSDEKDSRCSSSATTTTVATTPFSCPADKYQCKNSLTCINKSQICDRKKDCLNGDDELLCSVKLCEKDNGNCTHSCHETRTSYYCSCKLGFKLLNDSKTCEDINECEIIGQCSQKCENTIGSFKCHCMKGYASNGRRCVPITGKKEKLVVAVGSDVRSVRHDGSQMRYLAGNRTKNAVAVDMHCKNEIMFWADAYLGKIYKSIFGGNGEKSVVVSTSKLIHDLAIDWITGKIYWLSTSSQVSTVSVAEFNGSIEKTIITVNESIHSIALNPISGHLYWTSATSRKILRARMNGEGIEDVITTSLQLPTGLTIDYVNKKLYWLDSKKRQIESSDLDGRNRRVVKSEDLQGNLYDIAVFGDYMYWSDPISKTVTSANKFTGKYSSRLIDSEHIPSFVPKRMSVLHDLSQPQAVNPCKNNGGCSHLCLIVPNGFACACPDAGVLLHDGKNCQMPLETTLPPVSTTQPPSSSSESSLIKSTFTPGTNSNGAVNHVSSPETSTSKIQSFSHAATAGALSKSGDKKLSTQVIGGIIGGALLILLILLVAIVFYRRKKSANKMEIHYNSEAANVKILAPDARNSTQSRKDVDRDAYFKFANKNFHDFDAEDEDEYVDSTGEKHPVLRSFYRKEDKQELINQVV